MKMRAYPLPGRHNAIVNISGEGLSVSVNVELKYEDMVLIPKGEFLMGSNSGDANEKPVHKVYLDDFKIDKYEVTNAQYADFLNEHTKKTATKDELIMIDDKDCLIEKDGNNYKPRQDTNSILLSV